MKNNIKWKFDRIIEIKISGKNVNRYIKRNVIKNHINILKLTYLNDQEAFIILKYDDYLKLCEYKSIYDIKVVNRFGRLKFGDKIRENYILILFLIMGIALITFLSSFIFSIDVIHSSSSIRNLIVEELSNHGIKKYGMKKSYEELEKIEEEILEDNKDKLEWIEIESSGTKYIVRVEMRKLNSEKDEFTYQSIVTTKNCILYEVDAIRGEKVHKPNEYVKKGDTIISGYITLPDGSNSMTMASGRVLGEVWYTIEVEYPYTYYEEKLTGKSKTVYVVNFLGHKLSLFQFHKYHSFNKKTKRLFQNNWIDFSFSKEIQYEAEIISNIYTYDEAIDKAIEVGESKLMEDNDKIEYIKDEDMISSDDTGRGVYIKLFVKAIEDVGEIIKIEENSSASE